jgi:hypothetical protein
MPALPRKRTFGTAKHIAQYALANGSLGFVRSRTVRAWSPEEFTKIISELP